MPRPKGCKCGHGPCPVHPDRSPAGMVSGENPEPAPSPSRSETPAGGRPLAELLPGAGKTKTKKDDPPPRRRRTKRERETPIAPDKPDDQALVQMLAELLVMPAIPAAMVFDCDYCRDHFLTEGPKAARELVALSITNPALRGALESIHVSWSKMTIAAVIAGYLAKPMIHHLAPESIANNVGPVIGVPPRPPKPKHEHEPHPQETPQPERSGPHPDAGPPAGYDGPDPQPSEYDGPATEDQYAGDPTAGINET